VTRHVAIVTGASRGIGSAIAQRLAADGVAVLATARSLRQGGAYAGSVEETVALIVERGGAAAAMAADLADPSSDRGAIVRRAEAEFGASVDILVNNAAADRHFEVTYESMTAELFRRTLEVNVWAGWELAIHALPGMRRRGAGWILNISSGGARPRLGPPFASHPLIHGQCLYAGSKAMIDRVTTGAASELFDQGIAVNALAPEGPVATENAVTVAGVDASQSEPLETMAEAALALCTGDPRLLTGRVAQSLSLLVELGRPVRTLDGGSLLDGWQPEQIPRERLRPHYLVMG
jgi:NAD(P)-dependent dehydrogenase (short-subunit alcohol dehydrogenase family)